MLVFIAIGAGRCPLEIFGINLLGVIKWPNLLIADIVRGAVDVGRVNPRSTQILILSHAALGH